MTGIVLELRGVSAGYDGRPILERVDLPVARGELVGLIGPNGSGKTTLLRCLAGTLRPWQGEVRVFGERVTDLATVELARLLAVVPQVYELPPGFSVQEIVAMGRTPHVGLLGAERRQDREIVEAALRTTGVSHLAPRPVEQLSGGERQKVILARALAQEPRLLLLDEPTAHLDVRHQMETLELVGRLCAQRGLTCLAVLHDLNLASQYCDRLILLRSGRILSQGRPQEVISELQLSQGFSARMTVLDHPSTGRPVVAPQPSRHG